MEVVYPKRYPYFCAMKRPMYLKTVPEKHKELLQRLSQRSGDSVTEIVRKLKEKETEEKEKISGRREQRSFFASENIVSSQD
jgi:hypothetical protein